MDVARYLDSFFRIRVQVPQKENALLGVLPIMLILGLWYFATLGRTEFLKLPEGFMEERSVSPTAGLSIDESAWYVVPGYRLVQGEKENFLVGEVATFPLQGIWARSGDGGARVKLPRGWFVGTVIQEISVHPGAEVTSVGRGGNRLSPSPATLSLTLWLYGYEDVQTRWLSAANVPSPGEVWRSFSSLWASRRPFWNMYHSFRRTFLGFLVALLVTFPLGVFMGSFSRWKSLFSPLMVFSGYLPIPALVPLFMSLFGTSELQKVMFLAFAFGIYLLPLFVKAIEEVDNVFLLTAYTLGASRVQAVWHVLLGIAWPNIYDAMRTGFGVGWGYIILAEVVTESGSGGVGSMIWVSQRQGPREHIFLLLLLIVALGFITDKLWEWGGDWAFPYRRMKR